jgi:ParB family transcriptional regulator, chromosome partitioning protein
MKKRRTFDIDLPEDAPLPDPGIPARRSPMAAAITETADSLRERRAVENSIRAENDLLAAEHVRMKKLGLIVDLVPLDLIEMRKLSRDRRPGEDDQLSELVESLRDLGLSNPIRVEARDDGRYELIQGYRRVQAFRALLAETGDAGRWGAIPAGILPRGEDLDGLYRRMVDENLVRKDISFAEMADLARAYAADPETPESDPDRVVAVLFKSAGYQKRSYIRQFIRLMDSLGSDLHHPQAISRALGLKLVERLEARPDLADNLRARLRQHPERSLTDELRLLQAAVDSGVEEGRAVRPVPAAGLGKAKTTFQVPSRIGSARCTAANGRLEIKLDRDFSALDRRKLEAALARLLNELE